MTRCSKCQLTFPDHLISEVVISRNGRPESRPVDPECALQIMNEIHGMARTNFSKGTHAQAMLEECREYKAKMPKPPAKPAPEAKP